MKSLRLQVLAGATLLLVGSILFRFGPLLLPVKNIGLTLTSYQFTIDCYQLQLSQTGTNIYNPMDHVELRQPNLDGYFALTPPFIIELRQLSQAFFTWLMHDSSCNTMALLSLGLDSLVALVAFLVLIYGFNVKPGAAVLVSLFGYVLNFAAFFGNISTPSVTPVGTILLLLLIYFFSNRLPRHFGLYASGLGACLGLLIALHSLFIILLPLVWISVPKPFRTIKVLGLASLVTVSMIALTYGFWGFQSLSVFWTQLIPYNRQVLPESIFTLLPWFSIPVGQTAIGSQLIIGLFLYALIIVLLYKRAIGFFAALLYTLMLACLFQTNFGLDFAVSSLFIGVCLTLIMRRNYTAIAWAILQWVLGIVVIFVTIDKIPELFSWQHELLSASWYTRLYPYVVPLYSFINLMLSVVAAYFFVKPRWFKIGLLAALIFIVALTVRFYLLQALPPNYQTEYNYDAQIYVYQSQLASQGVNLYDLNDHPELRDSPFDRYSYGEPPLSVLVLAVVGKIMAAPLNTNVYGGPFTLIFFLIDTSIAVILFLCIIALRPKIKLWQATALALLWYGLSVSSLVVNILTINIKPLYIALLILMVALIYYLEHSVHKLSVRTIWYLTLACGTLIALLASYKQLTLVIFPFYWLWLWRLPISKKLVIANIGVMLAVLLAGFLPYFPSSLNSLAGRSQRTNITPMHASIFTWLPWRSWFISGYTVGLHTILNFATLGGLALLQLLNKIKFTTAATLSMLSMVIFTTEGSLDRFLVAFIPLAFYLILVFSKKQLAIFTVLHTLVASVLVVFPYFYIPLLFWQYWYDRSIGSERLQGLYALITLSVLVLTLLWPKFYCIIKSYAHRFTQ